MMMLNEAVVQQVKAKYSEKYNIYDVQVFHREYDDSYEILGKIDDPTVNMNDFVGREVLFPKKWVTLEVVSN
jgi:hypothetical protein